MTAWDLRRVQFVTGSSAPQSTVERVSLPLEDGQPPASLTNPTAEHLGEWHLMVPRAGEVLIYERCDAETTHP